MKIEKLIDQCIAEAIIETSQPEPYDPETDSFQPSPRERSDEPKGGDRFRNLDNILPTIRSLYGEQPSIQDIVDFFSTRVREQAPSRLVRQIVAIFIKDNPNFFIILPHRHEKASVSEIKSLVKEGVVNVLKESLMEGFDPQSAGGPNPTVNEPGFYDRMNAKMQKMEEGEEDSSVCYERGYDDGKKRKNPPKNSNHAYSIGYYDGVHDKPKASADVVKRTIKEMELSSEPHGFYAQEAGAGQFDQRDFGVNETK